jgi:hypothetical protein
LRALARPEDIQASVTERLGGRPAAETQVQASMTDESPKKNAQPWNKGSANSKALNVASPKAYIGVEGAPYRSSDHAFFRL